MPAHCRGGGNVSLSPDCPAQEPVQCPEPKRPAKDGARGHDLLDVRRRDFGRGCVHQVPAVQGKANLRQFLTLVFFATAPRGKEDAVIAQLGPARHARSRVQLGLVFRRGRRRACRPGLSLVGLGRVLPLGDTQLEGGGLGLGLAQRVRFRVPDRHLALRETLPRGGINAAGAIAEPPAPWPLPEHHEFQPPADGDFAPSLGGSVLVRKGAVNVRRGECFCHRAVPSLGAVPVRAGGRRGGDAGETNTAGAGVAQGNGAEADGRQSSERCRYNVGVIGATCGNRPIPAAAETLKVPLIWVEGRMKKKNPSSGIGLPKRIETAGFAL